jgi:hypothetical protein
MSHQNVPEAIKWVTRQELIDLTRRARDLHLTGRGREPEWLAERLSDTATGVLRALLSEPHPQPAYRCFVVIQRTHKTLDHFPLDVLPHDFDQLEDVRGRDLLRLTRWALFQIPFGSEGTPALAKMPPGPTEPTTAV